MSTATDMLTKYLAAEEAILSGQSYKWGERMLTRADLVQIQTGRREWERKAAAESRGGTAVGVMLADFRGCDSRRGGSEGWNRN